MRCEYCVRRGENDYNASTKVMLMLRVNNNLNGWVTDREIVDSIMR